MVNEFEYIESPEVSLTSKNAGVLILVVGIP